MEEDTEYKKLPVEDRIVHKLWKARLHGYEELTSLFRQIDDEKSIEFAKFLGFVKKFVIDSNAVSQEKGLEAILAYVENYAYAGKTVGEVMSGIVSKCIAAPKTKTKELAVQITMMYIEIEKQEHVEEELLKGTESKNPKIVAACVSALTMALREFGSKVISVKPMIKKISVLLADRDKSVRDEAKAMVVEIYRWIGGALRSQLTNLQPVQIAELETEFAKLGTEKVKPTRYLRSQQQKQAKLAAEAVDAAETEDENEEDAAAPEIDAYDLAEPVNILSKLPSDFYDKIEAKKWQERKEAVEYLETLLKSPKLENGDYGELVRALKKIITKDINVMVIATAGKCLASLAAGLKKRFQPYSAVCISALLEKFREKKQNVVLALREALDAIFLSTNIEAIMEDAMEALNNKNPAVKAETASFLARAFTKTQPAALNKKVLKAYTVALLKALNEPDPTVRDNSAEALGTALKLVGEKAISPFLGDVDALKMAKIKECCDKAVILVKISGVKKERPVTAPSKSAEMAPSKTAGSSTAKPVKRPVTAAPPKRKTASSVPAASSAGKTKAKTSKPVEQEMSAEEIDERASEILDSETLIGLADTNWKTRLASAEKYQEVVKKTEAGSISPQVLIGILNKKPGLKDTNVQVLKSKLETLKIIVENHKISNVSADACINDVIDKLGDVKNNAIAAEVLSLIAESTKLDYVANVVLDYGFNQKNPKVQQETLLWVSNALKDFGLAVNARSLVENAKKGVAATNPAVRTSAITLLGTLYLFMGTALQVLFENEKPATKQLINAEFEKYENEKPPEPTRGLKNKSASTNNLDEAVNEEEEQMETTFCIQDLLPRVDISGQITDALINELTDKNWKVRNEALQKVQIMLSETKLIHANIGDLPQALAARLTDSNGKIAQTAIQICQSLATAMGPQCKQHVRLLFPGFLQGLGDNKTWIRAASITCINTWGDLCGYKEFFDGEMIGDALKAGSPTLRIELWAWLADKLGKIVVKQVPKEELLVCIPLLYTNLEDRNVDVRKNAQESVLPFMIHLGYESMVKHTEKLKPGSKTVVIALLDKARPNLPVKPLPKNKQQAPIEKDAKVPKGVKTGAVAKPVSKSRTSIAVGKPAASRKKDDDVDLSPLLVVNNLKHQRVIDEQKLRVLKWSFTTPREEFVDLLKDQMTAANVNRGLVANMFHSDFRYHLKAIESLTEDLDSNTEALTSNLDLILKWLTLRFFDTNPSVLLKGLEYLQLVFSMLIDIHYIILENEASSFLPYLILKVGDPKDAVRNGVRALFDKIGQVYPISRLFSYIMEGLKSKNARQRTECLEELGNLIRRYGISICLPTPVTALKEIAKQISDRDNSVRNAALNCVVQAYQLEGEKILRMVGQISDKDLSLLEERIKRASKRVSSAPAPRPSVLPNQPTLVKQVTAPISNSPPLSREPSDLDSKSDDEMENYAMPIIEMPIQKAVTGPYGLDPDLLKEIESFPVVVMKPKLVDIDLSFLEAPVTLPDKPMIMPMSLPKKIAPAQSYAMRPLPSMNPRIGQELLLEKTISQMGLPDLKIAITNIYQMEGTLRNVDANLMAQFEDQFMGALSTQLKLLHSQNPTINPEVLKAYRAILTVLAAFYDNKSLGQKVSKNVLKDILYQLITLLAEQKLEQYESGDAYSRVINLQCVKIIEKSNHTTIICALIDMLHDSVSSSCSPRFLELIMKCLWRVIKIIPTWCDDMEYETILYEIHIFFKDFPSSWWKQKVDTPIRTIKTIVHSMAKIKGNALLNHLTKIENKNESELQLYLLKLLKTLKLEEVKQIPLKREPRRPLSRAMHDMLTEIFQKIGSKEATKDGLMLLYEFKLKNPDADISPYLERSSQFFQEYIERGLKDIEIARKKSATTSLNTETTSSDSLERLQRKLSDIETPLYWLDRLREYQRLAGLPITPRNISLDENYNTPSLQTNQNYEDDITDENSRKLQILRKRLAAMEDLFKPTNIN